ATRASLDRRLRETLGTVITAGTVVCAFVPDDDEAGGRALPSALAASGARVLLPVTPPSGPLGWAEYVDDDDLRPGRGGCPPCPPRRRAPARGPPRRPVPGHRPGARGRGSRTGRGEGRRRRRTPPTRAVRKAASPAAGPGRRTPRVRRAGRDRRPRRRRGHRHRPLFPR